MRLAGGLAEVQRILAYPVAMGPDHGQISLAKILTSGLGASS